MLQPGNQLKTEVFFVTDKQLSELLVPTAPQREELQILQPSYDCSTPIVLPSRSFVSVLSTISHRLFCQQLANNLESAKKFKRDIKLI